MRDLDAKAASAMYVLLTEVSQVDPPVTDGTATKRDRDRYLREVGQRTIEVITALGMSLRQEDGGDDADAERD